MTNLRGSSVGSPPYPREQVNNMGQLVFDMTPAGELILEDIKQSRHVGKTPSEFQMTRPEYQVFRKRPHLPRDLPKEAPLLFGAEA
mgnify:CR=1 FL=1